MSVLKSCTSPLPTAASSWDFLSLSIAKDGFANPAGILGKSKRMMRLLKPRLADRLL
jgi:hypothetical protein